MNKIDNVFIQEIEDNEIIIDIAGVKKVFPILSIFYINNKSFIALYDEELEEIDIFKIIEDENKEPYIQIIEDEEEWGLACDTFNAIADKIK